LNKKKSTKYLKRKEKYDIKWKTRKKRRKCRRKRSLRRREEDKRSRCE
jgi:hypothetical protein